MMHVASLMPFERPPDASPTFLRDLIDEARRNPEVQSPWNRKLRYTRLMGSPLQSWVVDRNFDLDYHVRRSALASPGDERELGVLISRLHSNPLDLSRPPWEVHLIEGLEGGRFAVYTKMHHALVDGYSGVRLMARSLSKDPDDRDLPLFFSAPPPERRPRAESDDSGGVVRAPRSPPPPGAAAGGGGPAGALGSRRRWGAGGAGGALPWAGQWGGRVRRRATSRPLAPPPRAPRPPLTRRIGRNRRFATQQYELEHLKRLGKGHDAT